MTIATAALSLTDKIGLAVTLIGAIGAAVASCLAAWRTGRTHAAMTIPSNGVKNGAVTENTNVAVRQLAYLMADMLKQNVDLPTPRQTEAQAPGATLNDPPARPASADG